MQEPDNSPNLHSNKRSDLRELATLTASKSTSNLALRWITAFLPTLERAFSTTTGTLTSILGLAELGGLSTTLVGRTLDRGRHRLIFVASLLLVTASSVIALGGSIATFSISMVLLLVGVSNLTVAGIAYIGERVSYSSRGRAIGTFETSWALSLLLGAPILAFLIDRYGWRAAYVALALLNGLAALSVNACSAGCGSNEENFTIWWPAPERLAAPYRICGSSRCGNEHFRGDGRLAVR